MTALDIIHTLIFGHDLPYLVKAVDPFTIAQLASGLVGAGVNFFGQKNQMDDQRRRTQTDLASERRKSAAARQTLQDTNYDVSQSLREFRDKAMQDPVADALRQRQLRRDADSVGALRSGGARALLGGLGAVNQASADSMAKIEADSFGRKQAAREAFGKAETEVMAKNTEKDLGLAQFDMGRALARGDDSEQKLGEINKNLADFKRQGLVSAIGMAPGIAKAAGAFGGMDGNFDLQKVLESLQGAFAKGGMVSPGEFSHKTNPIDMIRKGEKVGELTGGEVILNPSQEKKVAAESPYFRSLMKKFQADAKKKK